MTWTRFKEWLRGVLELLSIVSWVIAEEYPTPFIVGVAIVTTVAWVVMG